MSVRWSTTAKRWVVVLAAAAALLVVMRAHDVLSPFMWAAIFAYVFAPIVGWLSSKTKAPRPAIVAGLFVSLGVALYALGRFLLPLAVNQVLEFERSLPTLVDNTRRLISEPLAGTGLEPVAVAAFDQADQIAEAVVSRIIPVALGVFAAVLKTLVFVIALWYFLIDGPRVAGLARELLPIRCRPELLRLLGRIHLVLGQYVRGQVVLIAIMWTATSIGLSLLGVPFSILIGFVTGVLETVPIAGPITAGTLAVIVALGHPNPFGWSQVVYAGVVALMYTVLRHAEDYLVIPSIIGRIVELHPLLVIFALLVGGAVGGLLGILLAVPVAASGRIAVLYVLAKLRDEDPFPVMAEAAAPATGQPAAGVSERTA